MRMPIVGVRRFSQIFFLALFLWFCSVPLPVGPSGTATGWPVNWLLQLDPLVGLGTLLTTGTLYRGLLWGVATLALTVIFGRFFCGWLCPFGTLHQAIGWLGRLKKTAAAKLRLNAYRSGQAIKYLLLAVLLGMASGPLAMRAWAVGLSAGQRAGWILAALGLLTLAGLSLRRDRVPSVTARILAGAVALAGLGLGWAKPVGAFFAASLQTGLLDPLPLMHRTFQLALLPALSRAVGADALPRFYTGAGLLGALFLLFLALNLWIPRFYCRFLCPLGALFGTLAPVQFLRVGKTADACSHCKRCETDCEGGCEPDGRIRTPECVLCMNCLNVCPDGVIDYRPAPSASGEEIRPDTDRRHVLTSLAAGLVAIPVARVSGLLRDNWNPGLLRPPGALREDLFLSRCIQCGQCMRVCPTGIIQSAGTGTGGLWTPVLNFRIGSSGCQLACTACGHTCPTAAIRPLSLDEKLGAGAYRDRGPVRIGTAFVDWGRCLPWAMNRPCIVCQENCPVSPKAITLREEWQAIDAGRLTVQSADRNGVTTREPLARTGDWDSGDYFVSFPALGDARRRITQAAGNRIELENPGPAAPVPEPGTTLEVMVRLLLPVVDPARCIGCGICEHECPVSGLRAIRVTAENESRDRSHSLLPSRG